MTIDPNFLTDGAAGAKMQATDGLSPQFTPGVVFDGNNGTSWMYVKASGAIGQYQYVTVDQNFNAVAGTDANANKGYRIAFAQFAFADQEYGFVAIAGVIKVAALSGATGNVALYTNAATGTLTTSALSGVTKIKGIVLATAAGTASGTSNATQAIATYPLVDL